MIDDLRGDREVTEALRAAVTEPLDEVDWDRLYGRIIADAEAHFGPVATRSWDWVAAWSSRGIPVAASALAASIISLWLLPVEAPRSETLPVGAWPVAEELVAGLPEDTREFLSAADDVESLLRIVAGHDEGTR